MRKVFQYIKGVAAAAALLLSVPAFCGYPYVTNFSKSDYKAGTQNWDISQNRSGFMYFANNSGLLEYDGVRWDCRPIGNHTNVRSVCCDEDSGRIYAGAFAEFGYYEPDETGIMTYISLTDSFAGIEGMTEIWNIHRLGGEIYLQDDSRIYRYNGTSVEVIDAGAKINCSAVVDGTLYVACRDRGLLCLRGSELVMVESGVRFRGRKISAILPYQNRRILVATEFDGLYSLSGGRLTRIRPDLDARFRSAQVFCAAIAGERIAVGTVSDGVFVISPDGGSEDVHLSAYSGLRNKSVLSLFFDRSGNLWAGLDSGIGFIDIQSPVTSLLGSGRVVGSGYTSATVGGRLYLGTNQGLYWMERSAVDGMDADERVSQVGGISGQVWSLTRVGDDLLCGQDGGLYEVEGDTSRKILGIDGVWNVCSWQGRNDLALGCSYSGLFFIEKKDGHWRLRNFLKGFGESSMTFVPTDDSRIWLHHWMKGLFRLTLDEAADSVVTVDYYDSRSGFPTDMNNMVNRLDNGLVFSSEGGFYEFDGERMRPSERLNSMFSAPPVATKVLESPYGDLLFLSGSMQTIALRDRTGYDIDTLSLKSIQDERIPGFDHVNWLDRDRFIINTENGFSLVYLAKKRDRTVEADGVVVIKEVYPVGRPDSPVYGSREALRDEEVFSRRIRLKHRDNSLVFEFVAPQYGRTADVQYSYFLEKYEKDWSEWTPDNTKSYTKLPGGNFTFHVRARSAYLPDISESAFSFTVLPPWYYSSAAICTYVLLGLMLIVLTFRMAQERLRRRTEAVRAEKEEEIMELKQQSLENDLKHKSQDLADSTMNLIRKNDILIRIKNNLDKVYSDVESQESRDSTLKRIRKLREDIVDNIEHDNDWQRFSQNFDTVYEDYLKRLKKSFPQLTVRDLRLCSYLKMDLSSKDIASMLNMSVRSVEMARYRLRQKMGLSRDTNLTDLLQNF
ncbi:MAG: hypothetical protein LUC24_07335 [Bacteroidales bacterium]|nr:hypothetical protein [Bacteroidales bacterium]